jgi:hypothetical protein
LDVAREERDELHARLYAEGSGKSSVSSVM